MINCKSLLGLTVGGEARGHFFEQTRTCFNSSSDATSRSKQPEQLLTKNGDFNSEQLSTYIYDGVKYSYVTPLTQEAGLNILADSIKNTDFNATRIAIVCEHANEAEKMQRQLGKRSVAGFLINKPNMMLGMALSLWTEGLLNSVLILCDDMLQPLSENGNIKVNFLIHSTQPLPHVFQMRIQSLAQMPGSDIHVMVIRAPVAVKSQVKLTAGLAASGQHSPWPSWEETVAKDMNDKKLTPTQSLTDYDSSTLVSSKSSGYSYNNYNTFAWSQHKQVACFNIRDVKNIEAMTIQKMKAMNIGFERAKCVQRYAWPHVAAGRSMCVIGHETSGKTWCYLPWLCQSFNQQALQRQNNAKEYGPSCIILCANEKQSDQIGSWCMDLLGKSEVNYERVIKLFDRSNVNCVASCLQRPCGILITTMELLLQLRQAQSKANPIFKPSSIRCVAIDNLDIMWRCGRLYCEKGIQWMLETLRFSEGHTQLLIAGRLWSEALMQRLLPQLPDILLLFEDALEATIYGDIKLEMLFNDSNQHEQDIVKLLLSKVHKKQRIIVACQSKEDALELYELLSAANIESVLNDNRNQSKTLNQLYTGKVMIVHDDILPKIQGERIDCLVHYTVATSWQRFKERFRVFFGNYETQQKPKEQCSSVIFIRNAEQVWFICDFMFKHDISPPASWLSYFNSKRIESEKRSPRSEHSMCRQLLNYGNCCRRTCTYRHTMWDYETQPPTDHPNKGEIRFNLLFLISPSQLSVKLTKHEITKRFFNIPVTKLGESIQLHYELPENRSQHMHPKPGDMCILKQNNHYQRVGVVKVHSADRVEVKQLDAGVDFLFVRESELLDCEKRFQNDIFEANDLRLTGIMPFNMERIWSEDVKKLVRHKFFNCMQGKPNRVFTAKVDFAFHESIFVNNIFDEDGNDLKSFLLDNIQLQVDEDVPKRLKEVSANAKPFM